MNSKISLRREISLKVEAMNTGSLFLHDVTASHMSCPCMHCCTATTTCAPFFERGNKKFSKKWACALLYLLLGVLFEEKTYCLSAILDYRRPDLKCLRPERIAKLTLVEAATCRLLLVEQMLQSMSYGN